MSSTGRKRRRQSSEPATMAALGLPNIPGVPMDVLPLFVHVIRVATKFFAKCHGRVYVEDEPGDTSTALVATPVVLDSLMQRMEAATESTATQESQDWQERKQELNLSVTRWLESLKRFAKSSQRKRDDAANMITNDDDEVNKPRISVPYACFLYLWELQQTHERVAVRRAGVYLSGLLLQRSKDCRFHLEQEDYLDRWMKKTLLNYNPTKSKEDLPLLQFEADYWLNHLIQKGFAQFYPKVRVASQRLRQQCNHIGALDPVSTPTPSLTVSTFSSMADWRRIRDIALEHADKEISHVEKLIQRSHFYLEILVPRLGVVRPSEKYYQQHSTPIQGKFSGKANQEEVHDEDDDIEWEDGEDNFDDGTRNIPLPNFEHFSAVERTLEAMKSAGGLRGGGIEIDFRNNSKRKEEEEFDRPKDTMVEQERSRALENFQKCVCHLARRHMPRLTVWLEGLTNADNLVIGSTALVSLPSTTSTRCHELINQLAELKQTVSDVLNSATKLDINDETVTATNNTDMDRASSSESTTLVSLCLPSNRTHRQGRDNLLSAIQRQRKTKIRTGPSNRIQIKFRSK